MDVAIPWDAVVYDTDAFWSAGDPSRLTSRAASPRSASRATSTGPSAAQATATSGCTRTAPCSSAPAKESDAGDGGVQSIGTGVVNIAPGDCFELIARQTSGSTKNVAADELTWFAIEVVE